VSAERRPRGSKRARLGLAALLAAGACTLGGCFDAPKIEDQWTRVDLPSSSLVAFQTLPLGAQESVHVQTAITYRSIVTGYAVAELRASSTLTPAMLSFQPSSPRVPMAADIDTLLLHSVSIGRAIRAVTGWDHLIQRIDFDFDATVPAVLDSSGAGGGGLFFVVYLGAGQKLERLGMADSIIITPFQSASAQVLPIGMTLHTAGPGSR